MVYRDDLELARRSPGLLAGLLRLRPFAAGAAGVMRGKANGAYSHDQGCEFVPFVIDQYDSIGPDALQLLKDSG